MIRVKGRGESPGGIYRVDGVYGGLRWVQRKRIGSVGWKDIR